MTANEARALNKYAISIEEQGKLTTIYSEINMKAQTLQKQEVCFDMKYVTDRMKLRLERDGYKVWFQSSNIIISW